MNTSWHWGLWRFARPGVTVEAAQGLLTQAVALGFTQLDQADVYGLDDGLDFGASERLLGEVLAGDADLRAQVQVTTKGGIRLAGEGAVYDNSAEYLLAACEASVARLNAEQLECYYVHRIEPWMHPRELAKTLRRLLDSGMTRTIGLSNVSPVFLGALMDCDPECVSRVQNECHLLAREALDSGLLALCQANAIAFEAWSPLAGGALGLTASMSQGGRGGGPDVPETLQGVLRDVAARHQVAPAQVAIAWVRALGMEIIVGSQRPERLQDMRASEQVVLTLDERYQLLEAAQGFPMP